jgi:hypothetical protein
MLGDVRDRGITMKTKNPPQTLPFMLMGAHLGVQVEEHGHIHGLPCPQALLVEAEALDFVEIQAGTHGGHLCV